MPAECYILQEITAVLLRVIGKASRWLGRIGRHIRLVGQRCLIQPGQCFVILQGLLTIFTGVERFFP